MAKAIPELSLDTQTIQRILEATAVGDIVTYTTMTAAIGRDVQHEARGNLRTAKMRLLRQLHMVFGPITNVGVKRLADDGKVATSSGHIKKARSQCLMARATAAAVDDFAALPNHLKLTHNTNLATAGAIINFTSARTARKIGAAIGDAEKVFKPKDSLELMKSAL